MDAFMDTLFNPHTASIVAKYSFIAIAGIAAIAGVSALWHRL